MNGSVARPLLFLGMTTVLLCGCGPSAKGRLEGKWQGVIEFSDSAVEQKMAEAGNPIARAILEKFIEAAESSTWDFELKPDGSFTSTMQLGPLSKNDYGQWEVIFANGDKVTVRLTGQKGKIEQPTLNFVDDNTFTVRATDKAKDIAIFRCRRVEQQNSSKVRQK